MFSISNLEQFLSNAALALLFGVGAESTVYGCRASELCASTYLELVPGSFFLDPLKACSRQREVENL